MRDLVRAREDVRGDLMRAVTASPSSCCATTLRFEGNNWTQRHLGWLGRVELPEPVAQSVLLDGIGSIDAQQRLPRSWVRLDSEHGKRRALCAVAVARELTGFCWAVATAD